MGQFLVTPLRVIGNCGEENVPYAALVETEDQSGQGEAEEAEGARVGKLEERRVVDLRDGGPLLGD